MSRDNEFGIVQIENMGGFILYDSLGVLNGIMVRVFLRTVWETGVQSQVKSYQRLKKMVVDATLRNTQHYKAGIKDKVEQSRE